RYTGLGKAANAKGATSFANGVGRNDLNRPATRTADLKGRHRSAIGIPTSHAQCDHMMREARQVETLVQRRRADDASGCAIARAVRSRTSARSDREAHTIFRRNAQRRTLRVAPRAGEEHARKVVLPPIHGIELL